MCGGAGVEVTDGGREMIFRCPYCGGKGFSATLKLRTPTNGKIVCAACGESSRTKIGFFFTFFSQLVLQVGAVVALWLSFAIGPYYPVVTFVLAAMVFVAVGRILAPVWRFDAPYRAGFKLGGFLARVFKRTK